MDELLVQIYTFMDELTSILHIFMDELYNSYSSTCIATISCNV